jgi:very-short-patch-repair endonuclease
MPNQKARRLRQSSTDAEMRMWSALRDRRPLSYKFRRQHQIGAYTVDFACTKHALVIELGGGQHAESAADARGTACLESQGGRVIRFWNNEVLNNTSGVVEAILRVLRDR